MVVSPVQLLNAHQPILVTLDGIVKLVRLVQPLNAPLQEPNLEQLRRICQILRLDPGFLLELGSFDTLTDANLRLLTDIKAFIRTHPL